VKGRNKNTLKRTKRDVTTNIITKKLWTTFKSSDKKCLQMFVWH